MKAAVSWGLERKGEWLEATFSTRKQDASEAIFSYSAAFAISLKLDVALIITLCSPLAYLDVWGRHEVVLCADEVRSRDLFVRVAGQFAFEHPFETVFSRLPNSKCILLKQSGRTRGIEAASERPSAFFHFLASRGKVCPQDLLRKRNHPMNISGSQKMATTVSKIYEDNQKSRHLLDNERRMASSHEFDQRHAFRYDVTGYVDDGFDPCRLALCPPL